MFVREVESGARAALRVLSFSTRLVTTPPEMIECNVGRCHDQYPDVGQLAAHRILDHGARPGQAVIDARGLFGLETTRPVIQDLSSAPRDTVGLGRPVGSVDTKPRSHHKNAGDCTWCHRLAPQLCKKHGGDWKTRRRDYYRAWKERARRRVASVSQ